LKYDFFKIIKNRLSGFFFYETITLSFIGMLFCFLSCAQCLPKQKFWDSLNAIKENAALLSSQKLEFVCKLKQRFEACNSEKDSVYAKILHTIGVYEYLSNNDYKKAIIYTLGSLKINTADSPGSSKVSTIASYFNLGIYYSAMSIFDRALNYYDSAVIYARKFNDTANIIDAKLLIADIYFLIGDYEKSIEESIIGIEYSVQKKDSARLITFLNEKAQSLVFLGKLDEALADVKSVIRYTGHINNPFELATAFKTQALIYETKNQFALAKKSFFKAIQSRLGSNEVGWVASDYNDFGNFYLNSLHDYSNAVKCYFKTIEYAKKVKDNARLVLAHVNLAEASLEEHNYKKSEEYYFKAMADLNLKVSRVILSNPPAHAFDLVGNKDLVFIVMSNKTKLLLSLFKETQNQKYLNACVQTALLTDTLITNIRHNQLGEHSKLYWRNKTHSFFDNALEACYLAQDKNKAIYFLEKSKAVLLNDKLNELGAFGHLPQEEALREQEFRGTIINEQERLNTLNDSTEHQNQQIKFLQSKSEFERYIKSIEQKYPAYYQYKYDDKVPSLDSLQKHVAARKQSFIHYFINDTVAYILAITPTNTKFVKLSKTNFNENLLLSFIKLCANKDSLNSNYTSFVSLSNSIYKLLFQRLQIPKGRVIICADNFLIPFEALCTDHTGNNFLVNDYAFSYVYSARFLMKKINTEKAKGNFVGFAPVGFQPYLRVPELKLSAASLEKCAANYRNKELFINNRATRSNFLKSFSGYSIVNIFSHASADTIEKEPSLFMYDSIIKLSELQLLRNHVANLVILSACETDVGKNAVGEGIYSLARGFSAAGIPSVAATLWVADEQTIYAVSEKFHEHLSQGMRKDEALQKAKIYFMQNSSREKMLPYYWANMIIAGNTDPVKLSTDSRVVKSHSNIFWVIISGSIILLLTTTVIVTRRIKSSNF